MARHKTAAPEPREEPVWTPTKVQFLYRHRNGRYYVRTFAGGKEKWASLRTKLLSVARNRMKEHVDAAERERGPGRGISADGKMTFGDALAQYRPRLEASFVQPNTRKYREAGIKVILRSWEGIEAMNVRRITPEAVARWLRHLKDSSQPHIPPGAKSPARNSTGASLSTLRCALEALRFVLDVAVDAGHLHANPARDGKVRKLAVQVFKAARRQKAERGAPHIPTRQQFSRLTEMIRAAGIPDCRAAADFLSFMGFSGARKTEAAHATWSDVDFDRGNIRLRLTKNGEARVVPMFPEMRELLERLRRDRVVVTPGEPVLEVGEAQGFINSACKKLGIPRFTHHALRAMFGTTCLETGIDVRTVAEWLGHKDHGALLLKTYSHVRAEHEREMVAKVKFGMPTSPSATASPA